MAMVAPRLLLLYILFTFPVAFGTDCSSMLMLNMAACLPIMTPGSTMQNPDEMCCSGLKVVLETGVECLCEAFNNTMVLGVTFNVTMALTLPSICRVSDLSISHCSLSFGTSPPPAPPPSASSAPGGVTEVAPPPDPHTLSSASLATAYDLLVLVVVTLVSALTLF
ncbi:non-specific lipid transfer protein GPI-anchored 11-like [Andrographis paniculata]|uniref:non-specific lipid transfer protein GPI-anchored 11-like n=1 Tax=Andrographis paniculata TaxID=175694 RepID=UPI0021E7DF81|nr:non-specific lipid transfer protein GPI-anchored 11-like [Andrographis paniculata]